MSEIDLWRLSQELRDGLLRLAGPWRCWQPTGPSGWYRPTWNGGVAVRTSLDDVSPHRWAPGSADSFDPRAFEFPEGARLAADEFLRANGWILCDEGDDR